MAVKHIAFTVYPVKDMARARRFYEKDLGLKLTLAAAQGRWVEYHLKNGAFALTTMIEDAKPAAGSALAFEVDDVDKLFKRLRAKKVAVKMAPFSTPVCRNAIIKDPEGNVLILHKKTR